MIQVNNGTKIYASDAGDIEALRDVNLHIPKNNFISIVSPSGCGKSTLLKCIAGLQLLTSGTIKVMGKPVNGPPDNMSMVFQRDVLLDWRNILDNVMFPAEIRGYNRAEYLPNALKILERFGLKGFENKHPWELSGGMRQRVAICRTLLDDPELLFMDEPFGALDAMTRDDLNLELARLWQQDQKTVLFITHSIPEAVFLSDMVFIMSRNPGQIVKEIAIDIPHPRSLSVRQSNKFTDYVAKIRHEFAMLGILQED